MSKTFRHSPTADRAASRAARARQMPASILRTDWERMEAGASSARQIRSTPDGAAWLAEIRAAARRAA